MKKDRLFWLITLVIIALDQLVKWLVRTKMAVGQSIPVLRGIFHLTYIQNTGAGFGILKNQQALLIWIAVFVIGVILYNYDKMPENKFVIASVAFILAGAVGNLIDRIAFRFVIDFLDFRIWPAFNIADSALTLGIIGFIAYNWKK